MFYKNKPVTCVKKNWNLSKMLGLHVRVALWIYLHFKRFSSHDSSSLDGFMLTKKWEKYNHNHWQQRLISVHHHRNDLFASIHGRSHFEYSGTIDVGGAKLMVACFSWSRYCVPNLERVCTKSSNNTRIFLNSAKKRSYDYQSFITQFASLVLKML